MVVKVSLLPFSIQILGFYGLLGRILIGAQLVRRVHPYPSSDDLRDLSFDKKFTFDEFARNIVIETSLFAKKRYLGAFSEEFILQNERTRTLFGSKCVPNILLLSRKYKKIALAFPGHQLQLLAPVLPGLQLRPCIKCGVNWYK